jgi:UDP-N-acetylglucosamine acyltransferase
MSNISAQAVVERGARLAADVRVGPFSYIGPQVRLGAGCVIENNVTITGRTAIGDKTHVFPMAVIGPSPAPDGGDGECEIGEANSLREQVTVYAGTRAPTRIGNDNLIMIACQVGSGAVLGNHGIFANCTIIDAGAKVEDYVRSSAFALVEPGATVGAYTFIAGYAAIDRDAPPFTIVQGFPFRVRGVNVENLRRCGFGEDDIRCLKEAVRELYDDQGLAVNEESLQRHLSVTGNPCVRRLAEAIQHGRSRRRRR